MASVLYTYDTSNIVIFPLGLLSLQSYSAFFTNLFECLGYEIYFKCVQEIS